MCHTCTRVSAQSLGLSTAIDVALPRVELPMKRIAEVLATASGPRSERLAAQRAFLRQRKQIWQEIQEGRFPSTYLSSNSRKFVGAPIRTAVRCDFLLASKIALGPKYAKDRIADLAQRDLLFYVLRDREVFPHRTGSKFYCCPKCTSKLLECVSAKVFRYIDNSKWKTEIES
jgi:hypothetical protein